LKGWIKQPRPEGGRSFMGESYKGAENYGMPSLHAQSAAVSIAFLFLVKGFSYWTILELFVLVLVIYQRFMYKRHTLEQLAVGTMVGFVVGYCGWFISKNMIYRNVLSK
jgi:membrane-associated phospholipid phosphatase